MFPEPSAIFQHNNQTNVKHGDILPSVDQNIFIIDEAMNYELREQMLKENVKVSTHQLKLNRKCSKTTSLKTLSANKL